MILNTYIEKQLTDIFHLEYIRECLELRIKLCKTDYSNKNEYEKNEIELLIYQTRYSIINTAEKVKDKRKDLDEMFIIYFQELKETDLNERNSNMPDNS